MGVRAFKTVNFLRPVWSSKPGTRSLSYVPIDDRFFGLSDEEIELRGMTLFSKQIFRSFSLTFSTGLLREKTVRCLDAYCIVHEFLIDWNKVHLKQLFVNSSKLRFRRNWERKLIWMTISTIIARLWKNAQIWEYSDLWFPKNMVALI